MTEWSERYWEARWRDADAEVRRLQKAIAVLETEIARLEEVVATLIAQENPATCPVSPFTETTRDITYAAPSEP